MSARLRSLFPALQHPGRDEQALVERSIARYARSHRRYERRHPEIFNPIEQERLRHALRDAIELARDTGRTALGVLDLGCGSGNVTAHLVELGAHVTAADVSPSFLTTIERRFGPTGVRTLRLNGVDLSNVEDDTFDLITAYSVLHHIPDYLRMIEEIARVLRPGGIVFIDHEVNENFWEPGCVASFRTALHEDTLAQPRWWNPVRKRWQRFLIPANYVRRAKLAINPEWYWGIEGDIHVWPEDHIEWDKIEAQLRSHDCDVVRRDDYLGFHAGYALTVYERFSETCSDMRLIMARKR
jgi:ubiquinone/menaquinone biosynthesis C-methylase UbiE